MALPYESPSGITREPSDYPSMPGGGGGWQGPVGPGGVGGGPGDFGGWGGGFFPAGGFTGDGGGGDFRPDFSFGGGDLRRPRPMRLGMPRAPFSGGGCTMGQSGGRMAAPMSAGGGGGMIQSGGRMAAPMSAGDNFARSAIDRFRRGGGAMAPGGGSGPPGRPQGPIPLGTNDWIMSSGPFAAIQDLLKYGMMAPGDPNRPWWPEGGAFDINPPSEIMGGVRQRAVQDAGAQERAARLGLQSRADIDPSTYGFQELQSHLQGQQGVQNQLGAADLGLRQQQLENYWRLLNSLLGSYGGIESAKYGQPKGGGGLGGFLGGVGGLLGGISGLGGGGGKKP